MKELLKGRYSNELMLEHLIANNGSFLFQSFRYLFCVGEVETAVRNILDGVEVGEEEATGRTRRSFSFAFWRQKRQQL